MRSLNCNFTLKLFKLKIFIVEVHRANQNAVSSTLILNVLRNVHYLNNPRFFFIFPTI